MALIAVALLLLPVASGLLHPGQLQQQQARVQHRGQPFVRRFAGAARRHPPTVVPTTTTPPGHGLRMVPDPAMVPMFQQALVANGAWVALLWQVPKVPLTKAGLVHAGLLGLGLWTFLGLPGWLVGVTYLVLGSLATKVKMKEKERLGVAEKRGGARGPENVWGSAATAMVCAVLTYLYPAHRAALQVGFIASLATKLSDTGV